MNDKNKTVSNNDELDLGQVFSNIERLFKNIGKFIAKIFKFLLLILKKIGILILLIFNIIIKKWYVFLIAIVLGALLNFFLSKAYKVNYASDIIIEQNFNTGNILYNQIGVLKTLAKQSDSTGLSKALNISESDAANITDFSISHSIDKNKIMLEYSEFVRDTDSINIIRFDEFLENKNLEDSPTHIITVESRDPEIYDGLGKTLLEAILDNEYLDLLKEKRINSLIREKNTILQNIKKSDSLQKDYFNLLEKYYNVENTKNSSAKSDINLNLDSNSKEKLNTREYELFVNSIKMMERLNKIETDIEDKSEIFSIQKDFNSPITIERAFYESKLFFELIFFTICLVFYLLKELGFGKLLNQYGNKESLFEKNN